MDKVLAGGLHPYLAEVMGQLEALANQLSKDFMMTV
jgi:hypothetical protein